MPRKNRGPYLSDEPNEHGFWEIRWTENRRSRRSSTGETDEGAAQKVLAHWILGEPGKGPLDRGGEPLAAVLAAYWRERVVKDELSSPGTAFYSIKHLASGLCAIDVSGWKFATAEDHIDVLAVHGCGHLVKELTEERIEDYAEARDVEDGTMRRELGVLIAAINLAVRKKRVPLADAPTIPLPPQPEPTDRWLNDVETAALLAGCESDRMKLFCGIARYMGQRKRAIETLQWPQVDMASKKINFNPAGRRQTNKRRPIVPIPERLMPALRAAKIAAGDNPWVLGSAGSVRTAFENVVERAGLKDVTPHVLRHTWATRAAQNGVELWKIAGVLGDTLATVTRVYLHHCPEHLRDAVN